MPQMSSTDATFHAAQGLICALHNSAPVNPIVKLVNVHKKALSTLENIFRKATPPPSVPPRVPVRGEFQEKLQQVNQERIQIKFHPNLSHSPMHNLRCCLLCRHAHRSSNYYTHKKRLKFST